MPYIDITPEARVDISLAIQLCPVEISGIGEVVCDGDVYHISEITVFPQECYHSHTTFDQDAFTRYAHELNRRRVQTRAPSGMNKKRLWWHSHVWGTARFSLVDTAYMEKFGADTLLPFNPFLISIVGNKFGILTTRLDVFKPQHRTTYASLPLSDPAYTREMLIRLYKERMPRMQQVVRDMVTIAPFPLDPQTCRLDDLSLREKP